MKLLMISGDRSILAGKKSAFHYTLEEFRTHWDRIDVVCPRAHEVDSGQWTVQQGNDVVAFDNVFFHPSPHGLMRQPGWILQKGQELIAAHHHDVMTVHDFPPFYNGSGAVRLKAKTGIPAASEIHHLVGYPQPASLAERIGRVMTRRMLPGLLSRFDGVRTVNGKVKEQLMAWGVAEEKIKVVPSFYLEKADFAFQDDVPQTYDIVFCGRLEQNKGLIPLMGVTGRLPGVRLLVIGDGSQRLRAEAFARKYGFADRVTFAGWLPGKEDVYAAIRSAKMFVMCSASEGGPRVALEAMACGVPVVATPVGVMPDVVVHGVNGLLTDGTMPDLLKAIISLLEDDALRARLGEGGKGILDRFERSTLVSGYADFLKSLA